MKVGIFCTLDHHPALGASLHGDLRRAMQEAALADHLGLESFWVAEHHFSAYGLCPDPAVLLAAIAQGTRKLRLGTATAVLPFDHPLRVAEKYALLDQISGGRLEFGVGSGYLRYEFEGFRLDPEQRRERFDEALTVIRQAWAGNAVRMDGRHFQIDAPALNVWPAQPGGPPIHVGVTRPAAAPFVGRQGLAIAIVPYIGLSTLTELESTLAEYRAALPPDRTGGVTVALHAFCGDAPEDPALARAEAALDLYLRTRIVPGARYSGRPIARDFVLFGDAQALAARLRALEALGVDRVLLISSFGGLAAPDVDASLTRFAHILE